MNNKRGHLILLAILAMLYSPSARAQKGFDILYNFSEDPTLIQSFIESSHADSSQYFVAGTTETNGFSNYQGFLASFNYSGKNIWKYKLLFPGQYNGFTTYDGIKKIGTDRYILIGVIVDDSSRPEIELLHPYFYIFNAAGDSIHFSKYINSFQDHYYQSVCSDGRHIITAGLTSSKSISYDSWGKEYYFDSFAVWICKYDTLGHTIWTHSYMNVPNKWDINVSKVLVSSDSLHYLIAGTLYDTTTNTFTSCFIKTDSSGKLIWIKDLQRKYYSMPDVDVIANPTGPGYYFASSIATVPPILGKPAGNSFYYYGKLDENGDTLWTRYYMGNTLHYDTEYAFSQGERIAFSNNSLLIMGTVIWYFQAPALLRVDTNGNPLWYRMYLHIPKPFPQQILYTLSPTPNNDILMGGLLSSTNGGVPGIYDTTGLISWMILTDSNGMRYPGDTVISADTSYVTIPTIGGSHGVIQIYPNPFKSQLFITHASTGTQVALSNETGMLIFKGQIYSSKEIITLADLPPGIYFLQLRDDKTGLSEVVKLLHQ